MIEKYIENKLKVKQQYTIGVHDGSFHADDILAVSLLKYCLDGEFDIVIVRTREKERLDKCDIVLDVGLKYDNEKYFDHHQDMELQCSVSLIWDKYFKDEKFIYAYVKQRVLDSVSLCDTNHKKAREELGDMNAYYNISALIGDFNCLKNGFDVAIAFGLTFWETIIQKAKLAEIQSYAINNDSVIYNNDRLQYRVLICNKFIDVSDIFIKNFLQLIKVAYVICPTEVYGQHYVRSINSELYPVPQDLADNKFVHSSGFMGITKNKENALNQLLS